VWGARPIAEEELHLSQTISTSRKPASTAALGFVIASLALTACGGSSGSTSSSSRTTAGASTATSAAGNALAHSEAVLRVCLAQKGVTIPPSESLSGILDHGTAPKLPPGVTRAQYETAVIRCGVVGPAPKADQVRQKLISFAECMRAHGIPLPPPNTSGKGPVFNASGLNATTPQYRSAAAACRRFLGALLQFRGTKPAGGTP
jgi:hypothetical protein